MSLKKLSYQLTEDVKLWAFISERLAARKQFSGIRNGDVNVGKRLPGKHLLNTRQIQPETNANDFLQSLRRY